jgi:hypothetical protein
MERCMSMSTESFGESLPERRHESEREGMGIQRPTASTALELIRTKLEDPAFDAHELMRLVTYVMATLVKRMHRLGCTVEEVYIRRHLAKCIEPLRALERSIIETDKLRKRADVIDWDGEAIKKVGKTMAGWFRDALTQAGLTDFQRGIVMRYYRDLAAMNEPQLRRETER